jgi:hypothetical protein
MKRSNVCLAVGILALTLTTKVSLADAAQLVAPKILKATITIIDQQSAIEDGDGNPVDDPDTGLPETYDDTSVNLDALIFPGLTMPAPVTRGANSKSSLGLLGVPGYLAIAIRQAGFCASQGVGPNGVSPDVGMFEGTQPFVIPLAQILPIGPLNSYQFEGLTDERYLTAYPTLAAKPALRGIEVATFESEGPDFYDGDPWAFFNYFGPVKLLPGELRLQGITDLSALLGAPNPTVDLVIGLFAGPMTAPTSTITNAPVNALCTEVPATVVTVPVAPTQPDAY